MIRINFILISAFILFGCKKVEDQNISLITNSLMCGALQSDDEWYKSSNKAPLFKELGNNYFQVSTNDSLAQKYINQGLILAYGFNHAEAARSFFYASKLDPTCAMAYWGYAYVLGPNYNAGMESDNYERAYNAIQTALSLSQKNTTKKEKDLIEALSQRYVMYPLEDRSTLDNAYSMTMKDVYEKYPNDGDIAVLYAESLMNLHPWDLHDKDGNDKAWTPEIIAVLEKCIALHPKHPGAHHLFIHAVEASNKPERALISAQLFDEGLVPNSGHLVHMPSHIYIRTGDYHKASLSNIKALKIDSVYVASCNAQGTYPLAYYTHNQHFLAGTATLEGKSEWAIHAAKELQKKANKKLMKEPGWGTIQHFYTIPFYVYVKFGKWDEILNIKNEIPELDYPTAILHYAKGMAHLGKGNLSYAKIELKNLEKIAAKKSIAEVTIWDINSAYDLVQIAYKVLKAEILSHEQNFTKSISLLKEAIAIEDALHYNEPPDWFFSVRHNLGAIQILSGKYFDAIKTYEQDLEKLPKNGWALKGLSIAHSKLGNISDKNEAEIKFQQAWKTSDIELKASIIK